MGGGDRTRGVCGTIGAVVAVDVAVPLRVAMQGQLLHLSGVTGGAQVGARQKQPRVTVEVREKWSYFNMAKTGE